MLRCCKAAVTWVAEPGGIGNNRQGGVGNGMGQPNNLGKEGLGGGEGGLHGGGPEESRGWTFETIFERGENLGGVLDEPSIEIHHPQEPLELLAVGGGRKRQNGVKVLCERGDAGGRDGVAEKINGLLAKGALGRVDHQSKLPQALAILLEMDKMLLHVGAGDEDVVKVNEDEAQPSTNPVHHALKRVARIAQAKRQDHKLPETEGGDDRRLGNICRVHVDLVVALDEVQLRKHRLTTKSLGEILDMRDWIAFRGSHGLAGCSCHKGASCHLVWEPYTKEKPRRRLTCKMIPPFTIFKNSCFATASF